MTFRHSIAANMVNAWVVVCDTEGGTACYGPFETPEEAEAWLRTQPCHDPDAHYIATLDPAALVIG